MSYMYIYELYEQPLFWPVDFFLFYFFAPAEISTGQKKSCSTATGCCGWNSIYINGSEFFKGLVLL